MSQEPSVENSSRAVSGLVVPGGRPAENVAFEERVVSFFVEAADLLGVPKSVAAIYGVIFASPVPLSFSDVEARLDISKGSISQGLRVLREVGAIRLASGAGSEEGRSETEIDESVDSGAKLQASNSQFGRAFVKAPISAPNSVRGTLRRDLYVPDLALRKLITHFLETRLSKQLTAGASRLAALCQAIPYGESSQSEVLRMRMKSLTDWHRKTQALLPIAKAFLKGT